MSDTELNNAAGVPGRDLDAAFWNERWRTGETGWDVGYATPPIKEYIQQYGNWDAAILIPGCGNAYEAEYLLERGFTNITLLDISHEACSRLKDKFAHSSAVNVMCGDFFLHTGQYDVIIEQTFFCAQLLERRTEYAQKVASLLKPGGRLIGVLFNRQFDRQGPPFGGTADEYTSVFQPYFTIHSMDPCYNSIGPRTGTELFINMQKK
ncbi:MAG: methyltransferase domain-containing protein [Chlorobi bacterium]|nr:MAG: methyltransferase domain-containing protein [Bacteroidota bacterium]MBE2266359.1 methyltransferase domain-containing protein [Flavobacteriales bacterium]MBL1162123.1 methyltransferase domain-containing protein [Chlorobiota bacterium]MBW7853512.1 methyltransferase domain-containing protein [Candidatus Kapabacteria bacterium]MCC6331565.1 methyltransferase domain-containing protein [Ignavibacteria bacterium]